MPIPCRECAVENRINAFSCPSCIEAHPTSDKEKCEHFTDLRRGGYLNDEERQVFCQEVANRIILNPLLDGIVESVATLVLQKVQLAQDPTDLGAIIDNLRNQWLGDTADAIESIALNSFGVRSYIPDYLEHARDCYRAFRITTDYFNQRWLRSDDSARNLASDWLIYTSGGFRGWVRESGGEASMADAEVWEDLPDIKAALETKILIAFIGNFREAWGEPPPGVASTLLQRLGPVRTNVIRSVMEI